MYTYTCLIFSGQSAPLGHIVWGLCYGDIRKWGVSGLQKTLPDSNTFLMSAAEKPDVVTKIKELGWDVQSVPGAGNKLMKVALGEYISPRCSLCGHFF